jgi:hypothetical protein
MLLAPQRLANTIGFYATLTRETSSLRTIGFHASLIETSSYSRVSGFMLLSLRRLAVTMEANSYRVSMRLSPQRLQVTFGFHATVTYTDQRLPFDPSLREHFLPNRITVSNSNLSSIYP